MRPGHRPKERPFCRYPPRRYLFNLDIHGNVPEAVVVRRESPPTACRSAEPTVYCCPCCCYFPFGYIILLVFLDVHAWISALSYATERAKQLEDHIILTWGVEPLVPRCHRGHRHLLLADALESIAEFKDLCVLCCPTLPVLAVPLQKKLAPLDVHRASRTIFCATRTAV